MQFIAQNNLLLINKFLHPILIIKKITQIKIGNIDRCRQVQQPAYSQITEDKGSCGKQSRRKGKKENPEDC